MLKESVSVNGAIALTVSRIKPEQFNHFFIRWMCSVYK